MNLILDLLFPNRCLGCQNIIDANDAVCDACVSLIDFANFSFTETNLLEQKCRLLFPTEKAVALMLYQKSGLSQKIIHELKYNGRSIIGKTLAKWTVEKNILSSFGIDIITSIPLHPRKQKERGYNQLHHFVEYISKETKIPYSHNLLKRNFYSKPQAQKDREHRSEIKNLFSVQCAIQDKHILLIDDVYTTGNTISSAAWELIKKGNNKISILVMAVDF
ncbi:ComF family protein [Riemerella columbipharyngis]|uniref:ComF family protein n=1 Tax=Riemerella columbipharyngis TaxID=1071918 RepID=A0A1G7CZL5_9FLAO|nr:double zinc ribbon domain-containing protein [Riemerella columbipharyngis]SDE44782.1 comF family protein [Riemerella columbipharyngis]